METAIAIVKVKTLHSSIMTLCGFWATEKILFNIWDVEHSMDTNTSKK